MKLHHVSFRCFRRSLAIEVSSPLVFSLLMRRRNDYEDLKLAIQSIVQQKVVRHPYTMWLHRMLLSIVEVANVRYFKKKKD